jgi:hypothetical protein
MRDTATDWRLARGSVRCASRLRRARLSQQASGSTGRGCPADDEVTMSRRGRRERSPAMLLENPRGSPPQGLTENTRSSGATRMLVADLGADWSRILDQQERRGCPSRISGLVGRGYSTGEATRMLVEEFGRECSAFGAIGCGVYSASGRVGDAEGSELRCSYYRLIYRARGWTHQSARSAGPPGVGEFRDATGRARVVACSGRQVRSVRARGQTIRLMLGWMERYGGARTVEGRIVTQ